MHPFGAAVEARDMDAAIALLSEDVVFRSPIVFKPYHGRAAVAPILHAVARVFEDFRYTREIGAPDAPDHALVFRARIGELEIEGSDFLHHNQDGSIVGLLSGPHQMLPRSRAAEGSFSWPPPRSFASNSSIRIGRGYTPKAEPPFPA